MLKLIVVCLSLFLTLFFGWCYLFVFACNFSIDSINKIQNKYKIYRRDDSFHPSSEHIYQHLFPCISDQWTFRYK